MYRRTDIGRREPLEGLLDLLAHTRLRRSRRLKHGIDEQHRRIRGQMRRIARTALRRGGLLRPPALARDEIGDRRDALGAAVAPLPQEIAEDVTGIARLEDLFYLERVGADVEKGLNVGDGERSNAMGLEFLEQLGLVGEVRADEHVARVVKTI